MPAAPDGGRASADPAPLDPLGAAGAIDRDLRRAAVAGRAEQERAYLESDLTHYGVPVPAIRRVVRAVLRTHADVERGDLLALVDPLWSAHVHEMRMAAVEVLTHRADLLLPADLERLERLLREARTWALVDPLAIHAVGRIVETHPESVATLDRWSRDDDLWLRRAVLLAFLLPLRRGADVFPTFTRYADGMLGDREFFIRKAIGWALRERTKTQPEQVFTWLRERRARASALTRREAAKHLPEPQRRELLAVGTREGEA